MKERIEEFIEILRNSFVGAEEVYAGGSCTHFTGIIQWVFPSSEVWESKEKKHVIIRYENRFYDIRGEMSLKKVVEDNYHPANMEFIRRERMFDGFSLYEESFMEEARKRRLADKR